MTSEPTVFRNSKDTLDVIKVPGDYDKDQVIFCKAGIAVSVFNALKEYLDISMTVVESPISDTPVKRLLENDDTYNAQERRIDKIDRLSRGNDGRITSLEEIVYIKKQAG